MIRINSFNADSSFNFALSDVPDSTRSLMPTSWFDMVADSWHSSYVDGGLSYQLTHCLMDFV